MSPGLCIGLFLIKKKYPSSQAIDVAHCKAREQGKNKHLKESIDIRPFNDFSLMSGRNLLDQNYPVVCGLK